ncbi:MAG TPA: hypothetical protein DHW14_04100 [Clostridiales bacterium]|nr:hypothetical protein [Clostridiales bacterium]
MPERRGTLVEGRFYPSIFIGIGGAGTTVVEAVYRRLRDTYDNPQVLRTFQFLAIDTRMRAQQKSEMPRSCYRTFGGFDGREWVKTLWPQDEFFRKWWWWMPEACRPYGSKINDKGAGARRIDGRLCLLANMAGGARIDEAIQRACDEATDILKSMSVPSPVVSIYICNSLSGGTGSGMFIDLAFLLRDRLTNYKAKIYAFLLTPAVVDLWANDLQRDRRTANAYAALCELDFWQNQQRVNAPYHWRVSGRDVIIDYERPFDLVHLIDVSNKDNKKVNDYHTIINAVADMIFYLAIGQASEDIQGPLDNLQFDEGQETYRNRFTGERKPRTYGSGAVAVLRFPVARFSRYVAGRLITGAGADIRPDTRRIEPEISTTARELGNRIAPAALEELLREQMTPFSPLLKALERERGERARQVLRARLDKVTTDLEQDKRHLETAGYDRILRQVRTRLREFVHAEDRGMLAQPDPHRLAVTLEALRRFDREVMALLDPASDKSLYSRRDAHTRQLEQVRAQLGLGGAAPVPNRPWRAADARRMAGLAQEFYRAAAGVLIADTLIRLYLDLRPFLNRYLEVLRFVLEEVEPRLEKTAERVVRNTFTVEEEHGLVVEVLSDETGRSWLEKRLADLRESGQAQAVPRRIAEWLVAQVDEMVRELEMGRPLDKVMGSRRLSLDETVEAFFSEEAKVARKAVEDMTLWQALVDEALACGAESPQQIQDHILKKVEDLAQRALPLWHLKGGPYEVPLDRVTILAHVSSVYDPVKAEYRLPELKELVSPIIGDFTLVEASWPDAAYEATVVCLEYGAPLGLFAPLTEYRRAYRKVSKNEQIPLLTDRRFVADERYIITDPSFAAADPARLAFLVAHYVHGTVRRDSDGAYVWVEPDGSKRTCPNRAEVVKAFSGTGGDGRSLRRRTALDWNRLDFEQQVQHLMAVEARLQEEIDQASRSHIGDGELLELHHDLNAVKSALAAELYHI